MNPGKSPTRARATFHHVVEDRPKLDDVSDPDRLAVFNPDACADRGEWIQIDRRHAISVEEAR